MRRALLTGGGLVASLLATPFGASAQEPSVATCLHPAATWIWCDDFEEDRLGRYFEHLDRSGSFVRAEGIGRGGSTGMRARFRPRQVDAGALHLAIGRTPQAYFRPVDGGTTDHREVYWRFYLRTGPGWTGGGGYKLTRATVFASDTSWAQAMIAHLWSGTGPARRDYLVLDPASGTDRGGRVITTTYNDFARLRWLGATIGRTPLFAPPNNGRWHCVEVHLRLNTPGRADGVVEFWLDGGLEASRPQLDFVGTYSRYGINAIFLENYWNGGAPVAVERYFDDFVVATQRIGC